MTVFGLGLLGSLHGVTLMIRVSSLYLEIKVEVGR